MSVASQFVFALAFARGISLAAALATDFQRRAVADKSSSNGTMMVMTGESLYHDEKAQIFADANIEYQLGRTSWTAQDAVRAVKKPTGLTLTEWASQTLPDIPLLSSDKSVKPLDYVMEKRMAAADGLFLEFGVFRGDSIKRIAAQAPDGCKVYGFDSFSGLPDDFTVAQGDAISKHVFDVHGRLPDVPSNVELVPGWFNETLPKFLKEHPDTLLSLVHVDSDLYSSAKYVLDAISDRIRPGTVIVFDELVNYPNYHQEELRALYESLSNGGPLGQHSTEWIGSMCPIMLTPSPISTDWGPCCAVALRVVT